MVTSYSQHSSDTTFVGTPDLRIQDPLCITALFPRSVASAHSCNIGVIKTVHQTIDEADKLIFNSKRTLWSSLTKFAT